MKNDFDYLTWERDVIKHCQAVCVANAGWFNYKARRGTKAALASLISQGHGRFEFCKNMIPDQERMISILLLAELIWNEGKWQ